jgi:hypothetical protein
MGEETRKLTLILIDPDEVLYSVVSVVSVCSVVNLFFADSMFLPC